MPKTVTLRLDDETYRLLSEAARADNRSIANLIQTAAVSKVQEQAFVGEFEMASILADDRLLRRLRRGSAGAKDEKGRFVG